MTHELRADVKSVAVVTPTTGKSVLWDCLRSVHEQTYQNILHLIYVDGSNNRPATDSLLSAYFDSHGNDNLVRARIQVIHLPENVGADGWYGHRTYAACAFLTNADAIVYLDEDNWFDKRHIEYLVNTINHQCVDWAFALRKIHEHSGDYVCDDDCESLGLYPTYEGTDVYHVDTNCYMLRREVAVDVAPAWYGGWGQDRRFYCALRSRFPSYACSRKHSVCYRLGGNERSVKADFFLAGNDAMRLKYLHGADSRFPWSDD